MAAATTVVFGVLVGADGPPPWPFVRAVVVAACGAACLALHRQRGRVAGALAALALGLSALIAGLGIGVHHLVDDPRSVEAIAGCLTAVGGVALVAHGAARLVGALHRWRKLLAVPAGLAIVALVVLPLTLAVFVTNAPPFEPTSATPADHGIDAVAVELITSDDVRLEGRYVASRNGAAVIVLGGIAGVSDHEVDIAAVLARHGYGVLLLNARGQGRSGGDAMLWGWWGEIDVAAGVDFLAHRPDVLGGRIGAIGMSVGGEQAIAAAGADRRLVAVVGEGATARGARDEGDPAPGVGGLLTRYVDWTSRRAAALLTAAPPPTSLTDSVASLHGRQRVLLIAAGTSDQETAASRALRAAAPDRVDVWVAADASHTGAFDVRPFEWERRVVDFLDSSLDRSGGS